MESVMHPEPTMVLESCHSTWLFDETNMRFLRIVKDDSQVGGVATTWQPYFELDLDDDSESFVVWLNETGSRRLRSWRHRAHCDACGGEITSELDLAAIAAHRPG